jgi:cytochrome c oxidase subunit IV
VAKPDGKSGVDSRRLSPIELAQKLALARSEVRRQTVASLGTAFGVVIGFVWTQVVTQAFVAAGLIVSGSVTNWLSWIGFALGAIVVTFICVLGMLITARSQGKAQEKAK